MPRTPLSFPPVPNVIPSLPHKSCEKGTRNRSSPIFPISANGCTDNRNMSSNSCLRKWVQPGRWTDLAVWLSRAASNKNRSKTFFVVTSVGSHSALPPTYTDSHHSTVEYVTCKTCKSFDTLLTKENRIFFMSCMSCGSRRSVSAIKSGFQAQVGKRVKK